MKDKILVMSDSEDPDVYRLYDSNGYHLCTMTERGLNRFLRNSDIDSIEEHTEGLICVMEINPQELRSPKEPTPQVEKPKPERFWKRFAKKGKERWRKFCRKVDEVL